LDDDEDLDGLEDLPAANKPKQEDEMATITQVSDDETFKMPTAGRPSAGCWVDNSSHAADHIAAGSATSAMQLLNRQIAASDFSVIKSTMIGCYLGSTMSLPGVPGSGNVNVPLLRNDSSGYPGEKKPAKKFP